MDYTNSFKTQRFIVICNLNVCSICFLIAILVMGISTIYLNYACGNICHVLTSHTNNILIAQILVQ